MQLPGAERAFINIKKLSEYVLNPEDPRGRHKARVFQSVLGITLKDAESLQRAILEAVPEGECTMGELDYYGQRYTVDCRIMYGAAEAVVRTGWIVRHDEDFPRLTTCYVLLRLPEVKDAEEN
jgi:uncharacterized protein DUF6883